MNGSVTTASDDGSSHELRQQCEKAGGKAPKRTLLSSSKKKTFYVCAIICLLLLLGALLFLFLIVFNGDEETLPHLEHVRTFNSDNLGLCQGHCTDSRDCLEGLYCFRRQEFEAVPGCAGGEADSSSVDYCVKEQVEPKQVTVVEKSPNKPLGLCEGHCKDPDDCGEGLYCYPRVDRYEDVPGCSGGNLDPSRKKYCVSVGEESLDYIPGKLNFIKLDLLLSQGLDVRLVAKNGSFVEYNDGGSSNVEFHSRPDAGATFPDPNPNNPGGWIYVSNAEVEEKGKGGVGAITFDAQGNTLEYKTILSNTTLSCGGGRTPWGTWISCEEDDDRMGHVYQVDPTGIRQAEKIVLGDEGGRWESFAYDDRNPAEPHFYVTEDMPNGALSRYTPSKVDWSDPWEMLLDVNGTKDYLVLEFDDEFQHDGGNTGTFYWTKNKAEALDRVNKTYPQTEGIDRRGSELIFVCKGIKMLYTLQLDEGTFTTASTKSGLFDAQPDQIQRLLHSQKDLLYFTEDGDKNAGVHARDENAQFYTIFESLGLEGETTGLAFSPDGRFMYIAYQDVGALFCIWRRDGKAFGGEHVDIKFHNAES